MVCVVVCAVTAGLVDGGVCVTTGVLDDVDFCVGEAGAADDGVGAGAGLVEDGGTLDAAVPVSDTCGPCVFNVADAFSPLG